MVDDLFQAKEPGQGYRGQERRSSKDRRGHGDRREEIRFELQGGDRRSGKDRRRHGSWDDAPIR